MCRGGDDDTWLAISQALGNISSNIAGKHLIVVVQLDKVFVRLSAGNWM